MAKTKTKAVVALDREKVKLPFTLRALQALRTATSGDDKVIHPLLDAALKETKKQDAVIVLERVLLHIGDVSRHHNILKEMGIQSKAGGAQSREVFRSVLRWWAVNLPKSYKKNLRVFAEFTVLENLMFYKQTTDRWSGKLLGIEENMAHKQEVYNYLKERIVLGNPGELTLIAKHLPKRTTGQYRTTRKVIRARKGTPADTAFKWSFPEKGIAWLSLNGVQVDMKDTTHIMVKDGDVLKYPRKKKESTLEKQAVLNSWIAGLCSELNWTKEQYSDFRKKQNTAEQALSNQSIRNLSKAEFMRFMDNTPGGAQHRVARALTTFVDDKHVAKEAWGHLGEWYIEWHMNQTTVTEELREAIAADDVQAIQKAKKKVKVKVAGVRTIDLLADLASGNASSKAEIDAKHTAMIANMPMEVSVFPILDSSGSMSSGIGAFGGQVDPKYAGISNYSIAAAMTVTFSAFNPIPEWRNAYGEFSGKFRILGRSDYKDTRPNNHMSRRSYTKKLPATENVLDGAKTFSWNMKRIHEFRTGEVYGTNMMSAVEFFVQLVKSGKFTVEQLPNALMWITDNENNAGRSPKDAQTLANSIGWTPLFIFWGIVRLPHNMEAQFKNLDNALLVGGFSEGVLTQILSMIRKGSISLEDEVWAVHDDPRYSVIS